MPLFPSPEPTVSYFDDLDHFKYFENEFPAIVYNDALMSKLDFLTEPTISPQHTDEFNLKDETSLSECNEEEQNVLYFNNLFPLNVIYPDDLKSDKDNDDDEIQSSGDMAPLPPRDQRHLWLRSVNLVHVLDFAGLTKGMRQTLDGRLRMVYTGDEGQELFTSHAWRRLFEIRGPLVREFILEFLSTCRMNDTEMGLHTTEEMAEDGFQAYWLGNERVIPDKGDLRDYSIEISSDIDFLGPAPSYVYIRDLVRRLCHRMISCSIFGRGQAPKKLRAERLARTANLLALFAQQQPVYHPHNHPSHYTHNSSTRSQQAATRNKGKAIVNSPPPTYDQEPEMVAEDDALSKENEIDKLMALISLSFKKIYKPTNNNLITLSNTSRANQDNIPRINRGTRYDNQRAVNVVEARENV
ncbi:hypothetical protein Tco_1000655, partial [Tanacetum coccineum]